MIPKERGLVPRSDRHGPSLAFLAHVAVAAAAIALACARVPDAPSPAHRELTIGVALPRDLERLGLNALVGGLRTDTLLTLAQDSRPEPRLATSSIRSPDGLSWTFSLASNIYFQDGRRATAQVLASLLQAATEEPFARAVRPNLADVASVTAPDEGTIVVRTRAPRALLVEQLSDLTIPANPRQGSLGPFIRDREQGDTVSFRAFDKYYRGRPGIDRVTYRTYRSLRAGWAAMMRGETDAIYEVGRDAGEFVQAESGVRVYPLVRPFVTSVFFNVQRPALRSAAVRRSLNAMVDRDEILRAAYRGTGIVADGPLWPFHWALANRPTTGGSPQGRHATGAAAADGVPHVRFTCLVVPTIVPFERVALVIQKQLYDHGIDMQLEAVTLEQMQQRLMAGDFDAALFEYNGRTANWMYSFFHSPLPHTGAPLKSGYRAADQPLDRLLASENDDQVRSSLADVYRVMEADPPAVFIVWPQVGRAMSRHFETPLAEGRDVLGTSSLWMVRPAGVAR